MRVAGIVLFSLALLADPLFPAWRMSRRPMPMSNTWGQAPIIVVATRSNVKNAGVERLRSVPPFVDSRVKFLFRR
jgi:hypothetical protein